MGCGADIPHEPTRTVNTFLDWAGKEYIGWCWLMWRPRLHNIEPDCVFGVTDADSHSLELPLAVPGTAGDTTSGDVQYDQVGAEVSDLLPATTDHLIET